MGRKSGPKVMAYFLFMQEQRCRPGWAGKSNNELQALCDPLWKRLSQEEKAKYKDIKKSMRKKEREARLATRIPQEARRVDFEGQQWPVTVRQVESPDLIWVMLDHSDTGVQKLISDLSSLPLQVTQVGILPSATFSSDGRIYRCSLAERSEGVSLASLAPLAVRVHCAGVEGVSNNERNRAKVARRLEGGRLTMSIGRKGEATFFKSGQEVVFMRPRAAVVSLSAGQLASSPQDTEAESEEVTTDTSPDESNTEDVTRADDTGYLTGEESREKLVEEESSDGEEEEDIGDVTEEDVCIPLEKPVHPTLGVLKLSEVIHLGAQAAPDQLKPRSVSKKATEGSGRAGATVGLGRAGATESPGRAGATTDARRAGATRHTGRANAPADLRHIEARSIHWSGWREGDEVTAFWREEGRWRRAVIHELNGDTAFLVCQEEPLVRAVTVPVDQLHSGLLPLDGLNSQVPAEGETEQLSEQFWDSREELVRSHLASLDPDTLELVAGLLGEEGESALPSLLAHLLLTPSGQILVTSLLPLLPPTALPLLASSLLHLPRLPTQLTVLLVSMVPPGSAAFCLLTEAVVAAMPSLQEEDGVLAGLLEKGGEELRLRVARATVLQAGRIV